MSSNEFFEEDLKNLLEELNEHPNSLNLHGSDIIKFEIFNKKIRFVYKLGETFQYISDCVSDIFKEPYKNYLIIAQEFIVAEFLDITMCNRSVDCCIEILDNDCIDGNIMKMNLFSSLKEILYFEFRFSDYKWEYIGEYDKDYLWDEIDKYEKGEESIIDKW